jgi:predicted lipoprotein with Yx(FWY)xxD motif
MQRLSFLSGRADIISTKGETIMGRMSTARLAAVIALAVLVGAAGAARADHHAVKVEKKEGVGSYLADTKGMTLYIFKKDTPGKSACAGECVAKWPLYFREKVAAPAGTKAEDFGTITREDGKKQTTYKGLPLYYFAGDAKPGDTNGQGVKDVWLVAAP